MYRLNDAEHIYYFYLSICSFLWCSEQSPMLLSRWEGAGISINSLNKTPSIMEGVKFAFRLRFAAAHLHSVRSSPVRRRFPDRISSSP